MPDLLNPHINPYLPSFANQRPRINDVVTPQIPAQPNYSTIHYVNGYEGARGYSLAAGASEILAESDPNVARIYVVACDMNGQKLVKGFRLVEEEEPKPITMEDLSNKMNEVLNRLGKLEEEHADVKPYTIAAGKNTAANANSNAGSPANGNE